MSVESLRAKAVVVGTGAGGAVAGTMLAEAGVDTLLVEEGLPFSPEKHKSILTAVTDLYVSAGATVTLGNPFVSVTMGRTVGGTTTINSSTCFRPPKEKVAAWGGPAWEEMSPFFEEVEQRIHAKPAEIDWLGGNWRVLKRGCDKLGIEIKPLVHNIVDCKKRGRCAFGCPEGAKQSVDVSFVPRAVERGARLLTGYSVDRLLREGGRIAGVAGRGPNGRFEIRADAVVLAMGSMRTPVFLLRNRIGNGSRQVGKGLRIHPAGRVVAEMDEIVDGHVGLPQGAFIDKWKDRGVMLEGTFLPPALIMMGIPGVGHELKDLAGAYRRLSSFGMMVSDTGSGRVLPGRMGEPFTAFYQVTQADAESMRFGLARLTEIYLEAGARRVFTGFAPVPVVRDAEGLRRLESERVKAPDLELMAFHPLGTCRMGADRRTSVVNFSLELHDVPGVYVMDGSVVPDSLGVNPQITIMSLAMRAGRQLAAKLGGGLKATP